MDALALLSDEDGSDDEIDDEEDVSGGAGSTEANFAPLRFGCQPKKTPDFFRCFVAFFGEGES